MQCKELLFDNLQRSSNGAAGLCNLRIYRRNNSSRIWRIFLFKKTGIPSFLFLILIGIILGPISRIISGQELLPILGTIADLTLIMVIFYSGMDINFQSALGGSARVFVQVLLYVTPSTFVIGLITSYVLHWELIQALIFGSIIGGETTAAVIIPVSRSLKLGEKTTTFLTLEPVISPIFSIVLFTAFLSTYQTGTPNIGEALTSIASTFSVGIVIGGILSLG